MARVARTDSVVLDQVLPRMGRAANYSRLWFGVAAGLAVTRNRRARRGAVRGLIALSVASAAANVLSKQLVGRVRPAADITPIVRRLTRAPRTTSFPSGHSASAAAFATGVLLETPILGAPVAVAAVAVAASRVVTGAHYPSDVVAGVTLGAAAGLVTQWWWPRTPPGPSKAGAPSDPVPAELTGNGVVVVANASSGSAQDDAMFRRLAEQLPDAEVVTVDSGDELPAVIKDAVGRCRVLGVAGGDGTVNLAARAAAERGLPLLVIPAGTLNHFARDLGVESVDDAISAYKAGEAIRVDLGRAGDQGFVNTSSTGLYVDLVRFREHWERRLGKWPAMLVGLVHVLRNGKPQELVVDGEPRRLWMLFAGNGRYLPTGFTPAYRPRLDDGQLDVRIVDADVRFARTRIVLGALTGTLRWAMPYEATVRSGLRVGAAKGEWGLSVDGEVTTMSGQVDIGKSVGGLTVYRPAGADR
jgi:diacylglycerol kinase family enzyme/membrane-associated phospholipid phosphatase